MEIARGILAKITITMSLLSILAIQVQCSTHPNEALIPHNSYSLDDFVGHLNHLQAYVPISSVATSHSSVDANHFSLQGIPEEIEAARNYPWEKLLGKNLQEVVAEVNTVIPSASIVVKNLVLRTPAFVLKNKGPELIAVIFTGYNGLVEGIQVLTKNH